MLTKTILASLAAALVTLTGCASPDDEVDSSVGNFTAAKDPGTPGYYSIVGRAGDAHYSLALINNSKGHDVITAKIAWDEVNRDWSSDRANEVIVQGSFEGTGDDKTLHPTDVHTLFAGPGSAKPMVIARLSCPDCTDYIVKAVNDDRESAATSVDMSKAFTSDHWQSRFEYQLGHTDGVLLGLNTESAAFDEENLEPVAVFLRAGHNGEGLD